jgi:hypothetical protein
LELARVELHLSSPLVPEQADEFAELSGAAIFAATMT